MCMCICYKWIVSWDEARCHHCDATLLLLHLYNFLLPHAQCTIIIVIITVFLSHYLILLIESHFNVFIESILLAVRPLMRYATDEESKKVRATHTFAVMLKWCLTRATIFQSFGTHIIHRTAPLIRMLSTMVSNQMNKLRTRHIQKPEIAHENEIHVKEKSGKKRNDYEHISFLAKQF